MKALVLAILFSVSLASLGAVAKSKDAKSGKQNTPDYRGESESCPSYGCEDENYLDRDNTPNYGETYEGNNREDSHFDGGGYSGGGDSGGGMIGELFSRRGGKTFPVNNRTTAEDRGHVIVYTTVTQEDINATETCTTITVTVVDKATGKTISTEDNTRCSYFPL